jgi:hypothetical protein
MIEVKNGRERKKAERGFIATGFHQDNGAFGARGAFSSHGPAEAIPVPKKWNKTADVSLSIGYSGLRRHRVPHWE